MNHFLLTDEQTDQTDKHVDQQTNDSMPTDRQTNEPMSCEQQTQQQQLLNVSQPLQMDQASNSSPKSDSFLSGFSQNSDKKHQ